MKLEYVTLTGADDSVNPEDLFKIAQKYPWVEFGILFSQSKSIDGEPRYPSEKWVQKLIALKGESLHLSAHLCGQWTQDAFGGSIKFFDNPDMDVFNRVQLNLGRYRLLQALNSVDFLGAVRSAACFERQAIIGGNFTNLTVSPDFFIPHKTTILFDASGGRGIASNQLPVPPKDREGKSVYCGYAGGIGLDNITEKLEKIAEVVGDGLIWIDMESKLRSDKGHFDLEKCEQILELTKNWIM